MNDLEELFSLLDAKDFRAAYDELTQRKHWLKTAYNKLTNEYKRDQVGRAVLDRFAILAENSHSISVTTLESYMRALGSPRGQIIKFLKLLEELRWGVFKTGRRGGISRFESHLSLKKIGQLAGYRPDAEIDPIQDEGSESAADDFQSTNGVSRSDEMPASSPQLLKHRFLLRPDYAINIDLPVNLTNAEADRFADFIKSVPFK
jgi:hypothetical protein